MEADIDRIYGGRASEIIWETRPLLGIGFLDLSVEVVEVGNGLRGR